MIDWFAGVVTTLTGTGATAAFTATASVAATGTLTLTGQPLDTETVTIDGVVYTFQTTLTAGVANNVLIGATASDSLDNLIAAINAAAGAGTTYGADNTTVAHPTVSAAAGAGDTMDLTARVKGTAANAIATTEGLTNGSWGGGTLSGGVNATLTDATHGLATGDGPFILSNSGGALPAGLSDTELYWVSVVDANTLQLHTNKYDAVVGVGVVDITGTGTGTHSYARPAESGAHVHAWAKEAKAETINALTDIDDL
jgi:hypothetical protein